MGTTSSVLQWHCPHCRAINTTENSRCIVCRQPRAPRADHERPPPAVPLRKERRDRPPQGQVISRRRILAENNLSNNKKKATIPIEERHLYDDAEGCDPPPVPAHKKSQDQQHVYAELEENEEHEYDEYVSYAVLEYPEPPRPNQDAPSVTAEPIYGVVNKVCKKPPPPPPPHLRAGASAGITSHQEPEAVYYSEVEDESGIMASGFDIDIDNLPPPLPPHKEELSLTTDARKWYCLNCRIWNTAQDSSCVYCAMPYSDDVVATGTGLL
ncbi:hypothetical protein BIW11_10426 [Tropilaelaps mercedesae]|uniref:RanBP2-type domain-containing protein n=1 Tax=Tropilaelaps mercedesae TaxID=418985 RepID=A0A1V9XFN9_9ACAR|nr:hypothetical protein BIW11_10426 [Tropilaelaps mercedesae]